MANNMQKVQEGLLLILTDSVYSFEIYGIDESRVYVEINTDDEYQLKGISRRIIDLENVQEVNYLLEK